jgi:phosphoribosylformimino-5-aminoimidazole carboxamide ribonucleotide (ProFAR) isomerase
MKTLGISRVVFYRYQEGRHLAGAEFRGYQRTCPGYGLKIIASGGVSTPDDLGS